jgi:hypothetical protein
MAPLLLRDRARGGTDAVAMAHATVTLHALAGRVDGITAVAGRPAPHSLAGGLAVPGEANVT